MTPMNGHLLAARGNQIPGTELGSRWRLAGYGVAVAGPAGITVVLSQLVTRESRDYIFAYLAVVAALGVIAGFRTAMVAALASFGLVDYSFVPPVHTFTIADPQDLANLTIFVCAAAVIGGLGSRRRSAQLRAEALTRALETAVKELEHLNREQSTAAATALRLAQAQQQVHLLERTDLLRSELLANVSHELRTPLSGILTGATDLLHDPGLSPHGREEIEAVVRETKRLSQLVSDMLDMARIEGGRTVLNLSEVDIHEAIDAAVLRLARMSPSRTVDVDVPEELEVIADWERLGQILDNLLANADRYGPADTSIRVQAVHGKRATVVVRVVDEGPGVPADHRDRIFERFVRSVGDQHTTGGGTGLGLAIVRGLVEAHAGHVWIEDPAPGEGGRFAFTLPAAVTPPGPERER